MATSIRRLGSHSPNVHRSVLPKILRRFSSEALSVEDKAGEIGMVSATSDEHLRRKKLERIADELLSLTKLERNDYAVLLRYKMGFNNYGPSITSLGPSSAGAASAGPGSETKAAEKVVFDVKIEKFDAASKIKIIKEVRAFTDLGLKEAKDLVEKVPVVVKKGITKDEAESIMAKLKDLGATVVLE